MSLRDQMIDAGVLRPARGESLTTPSRTTAAFPLDEAGRAKARKHISFGDIAHVPDGAFIREALRRPPLFGRRPR